MKKIIKVFIVDDHEIFRNGLKMVFNRCDDIEVAGEAESGEEFIEKINDAGFDVVLMDIKMNGMNGIETTKKALDKNPDLKILVLSTFGEEEFLEQILQAGAKGFILKNVLKEVLFNAIKTVHSGQNYFSPELLPYFTKRFTNNGDTQDIVPLTERELEVLTLIGKGYSNDEIAEKLFISKRTVDTHKNNLISKTGSKNIVSLLIYAIKNKLIDI
ncbi:MAG: DNA-binding response regulator [Bacteroidetes bacterium]|nr:MAG: DNA-binding response regulator [Bacteroidota bacterium]